MTVFACVIFNVSMVAPVARVAFVICAISAFVPTLCVGIGNGLSMTDHMSVLVHVCDTACDS